MNDGSNIRAGGEGGHGAAARATATEPLTASSGRRGRPFLSYFPFNYLTCYSLRREWSQRRFVWRYVWYYRRVTLALAIPIALCFVLTFLPNRISCPDMHDCGTFVNYRCDVSALSFITVFALFVLGLCFLEAIACVLSAQALNMLVHTTVNDFQEIKKWSRWFLYLAKVAPWICSFLHYLWILFSAIALIFVLFAGCIDAYTPDGETAVRLCRWTHYDCCQDGCPPGFTYSNIYRCNDLEFLINNRFFTQIDDIPQNPCAPYVTTTTTTIQPWDGTVPFGGNDAKDSWDSVVKADGSRHIAAAAVSGVGGRPAGWCATVKQCPVIAKGTSGMYKFLLSMTLIPAAICFICTATLIFVKLKTPIDANLYIPRKEDELIFWKWLRVLTPW